MQPADTKTAISLKYVETGNKEAREGTARFLCRHSAECSHFIFSNTVCVTTLVYYTAYLAPLALFPCRGVSRCTDKRTVCNRSFDRASWTTSLKNVTFRRTRMLRSRSPIVVEQLQKVGNMWNWRNGHQQSFAVRGLVEIGVFRKLIAQAIQICHNFSCRNSLKCDYLEIFTSTLNLILLFM